MRNVIGRHGSSLLSACVMLFLQACSGGGGGGGGGESEVFPNRKPQVVVQVIEPNGTQGAVDVLYLVESGTQVLTKIADLGEHFSARHFSVSPGGKKLAYWSLDGSHSSTIYSFWLSNIDGGDKSQVHFSYLEPVYHWSPNGDHLLYLGYQGGDQVALLVDIANGNQVRLTSPGQLLNEFSWSEDGVYFAYDLQTMGTDHEIWILDLKTGVTKSVFNTNDSIYKVMISYDGSFVILDALSSIDRLHIINTANNQITTLDNVFLYDFDWLPGKNSAYYVDGLTSTLYAMNLDVFSISPVSDGSGNVMADEAFLSPDGSKLFFNSYGLPNNIVGVIRTLDNSVLYSRLLGLGAAYPFGAVAWSSSSDKIAVVYEDMVSIIDVIAGSETEIKKMDSTSLSGVSKIDWLSEEEIALQLNRDIYVGEQTKNNFRKIGVVNHYGLVDPAFDSLAGGETLFYLSVDPVNGVVAPPLFSGFGLPVFYDVKANRYDVLRLQSGEAPSASYFQVVK